MNLTRYEPWNIFDQLCRQMEHIYGEESVSNASDWVPKIDIREEGDCFTIIADLPGVDPQDIDIATEGGIMTIKGGRDAQKKEENSGYRRIERAYGSFYRRFTLPDTADTTKISARSNNGVLTIHIPRQEDMQPRRITVDVTG